MTQAKQTSATTPPQRGASSTDKEHEERLAKWQLTVGRNRANVDRASLDFLRKWKSIKR